MARIPVRIESATSVNAFICWAETTEADSFWLEIDYKLEELINKRGTPWLTFPHPTIIEVDE